MRRASVIDIAFGRHVRRRGLFARILGAHDASRRMGARHVLISYRNLIASEYQDRPASVALELNRKEESAANADGDKTRLGARDPTLQGA